MRRALVMGILGLACAVGAQSASAQTALDRLEQRVRQRQAPRAPIADPAAADDIGYLGVYANDSGEQGRGLRITALSEGSPAVRDGLKANDLVTRVNDTPVASKEQFARVMRGMRPGTSVTFTVARDDGEQQVAVTLGQRPPGAVREIPRGGAPGELPEGPEVGDAPLLGVKLSPITSELQTALNLPNTEGAFVSELVQGAPAERAGLPAGATILSVNGKPIRTPEDVERVVKGTPRGGKLQVGYVSQGKRAELTIVLPLPSSDEALPAPPAPSSLRRSGDDARWDALERRLNAIEQRLKKLEDDD